MPGLPGEFEDEIFVNRIDSFFIYLINTMLT